MVNDKLSKMNSNKDLTNEDEVNTDSHFDLSSTDYKNSIIELLKVLELIPIKKFNTSEEFIKWLDECHKYQ